MNSASIINRHLENNTLYSGYLKRLRLLINVFPTIKKNYGVLQYLVSIYKFNTILKVCRKMHDISMRINKINNQKLLETIAVQGTFNLMDFVIVPYLSKAKHDTIKKCLIYYVNRWRYLKWKEDGINRFSKPTMHDIMLFNFRMNVFKQAKRIKEEREKARAEWEKANENVDQNAPDPLSESSDYSSDYEYYSNEDLLY